MIGRIQGQILEIAQNQVLIDVGGLGYEVEVTSAALGVMAGIGEPVSLYTHFVVREDAQLLYGFASREERDLFRTLIRINGVGPKVALALLSHATGAELVRHVAHGDIGALSRAPGVGRKTAGRIVMELKDRLQDMPVARVVAPASRGASATALQEAEQALMVLGYRPQEAARLLNVVFEAHLAVEELVRRALQAAAAAQEPAE